MLLVNETLYRWNGMSQEYHGLEPGDVYTMGDFSTILPDGYLFLGAISGITEEVSYEKLQRRAAFDATVNIWTGERFMQILVILV